MRFYDEFNDLQKHKKSDTVKWVVVFLAVILLGFGVLAAITLGFSDWDPYGWFETEKEEEKGVVVDGDGNEYESGTTYPMPTSMLFTSPSAMSEAASAGVTLEATIEPADATNQAVDWSVAFRSASSSWATGKTVTDYVTVTPTEDGALTATVACLEAFGEKIVITVTSRDNPAAKATCTLDYARRLTGFDLVVSGVEGKDEGFTIASKSSAPGVMPLVLDKENPNPFRTLSFEEKWSVGTVNDTITEPENFAIVGTDEFVAALQEEGLIESGDSTAVGMSDFPVSTGVPTGYNFLAVVFRADDVETVINLPPEYTNALSRVFAACAETGAFEATFTLTGKYSGEVTETFKISVSGLGVAVTGITLNQSTMIL